MQFGAKLFIDNINTKCWGMTFEFCHLSLNIKENMLRTNESYTLYVFYYKEIQTQMKKTNLVPPFHSHFYLSGPGVISLTWDFYPSCLASMPV